MEQNIVSTWLGPNTRGQS